MTCRYISTGGRRKAAGSRQGRAVNLFQDDAHLQSDRQTDRLGALTDANYVNTGVTDAARHATIMAFREKAVKREDAGGSSSLTCADCYFPGAPSFMRTRSWTVASVVAGPRNLNFYCIGGSGDCLMIICNDTDFF